jgi:hypothetical protein
VDSANPSIHLQLCQTELQGLELATEDLSSTTDPDGLGENAQRRGHLDLGLLESKGSTITAMPLRQCTSMAAFFKTGKKNVIAPKGARF